MTKRILLYAALYGGIGAVVGVLMALYTKDVGVQLPIMPHVPTPTVTESTTEEPNND
jgi:hypothetical protein